MCNVPVQKGTLVTQRVKRDPTLFEREVMARIGKPQRWTLKLLKHSQVRPQPYLPARTR